MRNRCSKLHRIIHTSLLLLLLLAACSVPTAEVTTPTPVQLFVPATAEPTATPTITPTLKPTSAPIPTLPPATPTATPDPDALPTGRVIHGGNLRNTPVLRDDTVIGQICPTDEVVFLEQQLDWYHIQIARRGADCSPLRVATGTHGWVHKTLLSSPSSAISSEEQEIFALEALPAQQPSHDMVKGDLGVVDHPHGGNIRTAPYLSADTVIGQLCPGDSVEFLDQQVVDETLWYRVRVTDVDVNCTQGRVAFNTEGWVSHLLVSDPTPAEVVAEATSERASSSSVTTTCDTPNSGVFGINSHIASRYKDDESLHLPVDMVVQSGATWAREDFQWYRIEEAPDQYDWTYTDRTVDLMVDRGINVVGVFNSAVGWATPFTGDTYDDISFYPPDMDLFATFIYETVSRYRGRICYWEIWNEPEHPYFWHPQPDPATYAAMLKAAYPAIKAADPNAQVLMGGTVPFGLRFLRDITDHGAWNYFDILSLHPFIDPITPEEGQIGINGVQEVMTLFDQLGPKPIWVTEYGWASGPGDHNQGMGVDEETQANYLVRAGVLMHAAGAEKVFWYTLKDTELRDGEPFNQYGLLHYGNDIDDYSQTKPALKALHTLNQQITDTQVVGVQDVGDRRVVLDFETCGVWERVNAQHGNLQQSNLQASNGAFSAEISYDFPPPGGSYVAFVPSSPVALPGSPSQLGVWVYGDGSGHALLVQLEDAEGEKLQYRLGVVGAEGWQFLVANVTGEVQPGHQVSGPGSGNRRLDYPARLGAVVLGDETEGRNPQGRIYLDDLTVVSGSEAYVVRFAKQNSDEVVDVIWSPQGAQLTLPTRSEQGTLVSRDGDVTILAAEEGQFVINLGAAPAYFTHIPARAPPTVQG